MWGKSGENLGNVCPVTELSANYDGTSIGYFEQRKNPSHLSSAITTFDQRPS